MKPERTMVQYLGKVKELMARFDKCTVQQIARTENGRADALSKFNAMVAGVKERKITLLVKEHPVIEEGEELQVIENSSSWKVEFMNYLKDGILPDDPIRAKRLKFKATRFTIIGNDLYKRTIGGPLLKCLDDERAQYVLREVHEGSCGNHSGGRSLAQKITRIEGTKSSWVDELPGVLWAYRTTPRSATGETSFCLVYGTEAIIPAEIGEETQRITQYENEKNQEERAFDLTLIEEKRDAAYAKILHHKGLMMRNYNRRIKPRCFQVGDLVLEKVEVSKHVGKLDPGWEGPFKVIEIKRLGSYKLQDMEE
ncbi:UNVERIFIED_CONTAM: hypothetical protein Sradi_3285100 [Sesamum radiatum]|uniref:Reverse transcriptase domain-containing protein n=1 Tax=Sesamum radiatum TaxID=300843 RepID=A0AAW2R1F1_SESRA